MDWATYKELSHNPEYFTRWALKRSGLHLSEPLAQLLATAMQVAPLVKPPDHKGDELTDVLRVDLPKAKVLAIIEELEQARAQAKLEDGSTARNLHGLIRSWEEYVEWLAK